MEGSVSATTSAPRATPCEESFATRNQRSGVRSRRLTYSPTRDASKGMITSAPCKHLTILEEKTTVISAINTTILQ
jgi:hypothetical protein